MMVLSFCILMTITNMNEHDFVGKDLAMSFFYMIIDNQSTIHGLFQHVKMLNLAFISEDLILK